MKLAVILNSALIAFANASVCGFARSLPSPGIEAGRIYEIRGEHAKWGSYKGKLEVRTLKNKEVRATRIVSFDKLVFEGLSPVQQVWTADGQLDNGVLNLHVELKQADFLSQVDGVCRSSGQFKKAHVFHYLAGGTGREIRFSDPFACSEKLSFHLPAGKEPLWKDERKLLPARGECFQTISRLANASFFLPAILRYRLDEQLAAYRGRAEFRSRSHYFVQDSTDYQFYKENPQALRVCNKVLDYIALVEASFRQDAYSHSLRSKMLAFEAEMKNEHLNELALFAGAVCGKSGEKIGYSPNGDSALWTGMYAGSQAMRFMVMKDPEALANFRHVLKGMFLLMDITENNSEFARYAEPLKPGEKLLIEPWKLGQGKFRLMKYLPGGNNDMIKGFYHAFVWAHEILPADDPLRLELKEYCRRLPFLRIASRDLRHPGNISPALGLAALGGDPAALESFLKEYKNLERPIDFLNLDKGYFCAGIADWSGVNLTLVTQLSNILIAKNLLQNCGSSRQRQELMGVLQERRNKLHKTWSIYCDCKRDLLTIANDAFNQSNNEFLKFPSQVQKEANWQEYRQDALWSLRQIPKKALKHDIVFDYRLRPQWCASGSPLRPWKYYVERDWLPERSLQGVCNYPLFEGSSFDTDNIWATEAFRFRGAAGTKHKHGRMDFLYVYWLGRISGLINEND